MEKYYENEISKSSFLITGGAGFIGSNLVEYLLKKNALKVRVLDNLSNGYFENIQPFLSFRNFEFIEGDIRNFSTCKSALLGIDYISHQAALGSIPRSIKDPLNSNDVNINGFLNILTAAKDSKHLKRMIYAASSSTYGDSKELPKIEGSEGKPLSPYAVTKLVNELYADVFSKIYGFHTIGMRYFNVFGPRQNPNNPYAAVIPLFIKSALNGDAPKIFGDGKTERDFTFVDNIVQANIKALFINERLVKHEVINIACGQKNSLLDIWSILKKFTNVKLDPIFLDERAGDIKFSLANIQKAKDLISYLPLVHLEDGIKITLDYYLSNPNILKLKN